MSAKAHRVCYMSPRLCPDTVWKVPQKHTLFRGARIVSITVPGPDVATISPSSGSNLVDQGWSAAEMWVADQSGRLRCCRPDGDRGDAALWRLLIAAGPPVFGQSTRWPTYPASQVDNAPCRYPPVDTCTAYATSGPEAWRKQPEEAVRLIDHAGHQHLLVNASCAS